MDNPWLQIPAADYEAHMDAVGQSAVLRDLFSIVYAEHRPKRLAVLGCTTGHDLQRIDSALTNVVVGVDINPSYLEVARERLSFLGPRVHLVCDDVLTAMLPRAPFDLVHAALLLEYVEPLSLFRRIHGWLSPDGVCSVITQEPTPGVPAVTDSSVESLRRLAGRISLRTAEEVASEAREAGLHPRLRRAVKLPNGKSLVNSTFTKARVPPPS